MTAPLCLLTRPEAQSRAFAAELPGVDVLISPVIRIEPLPFDGSRIAKAPGLIFTSANAVAFAGPAKGRPAICVGAQTADAAKAAGFSVIVGPGDAAGLLPLLEARGDWLHLHGKHQARPVPVPDLTVYDQVEQPLSKNAIAASMGNRPLIVPLFSPRSAVLLSRALAKACAPIIVVAISKSADDAYIGPAIARHIAESPDRAAMRRAILSLKLTERTGLPWVETERGAR